MTNRNPFQVIGLTPAALHGKNDQQIGKLLRLIGRVLLQVEHPDAGGNAERFKIVQNALEELEDPEKFSSSKHLYLQPSQKQLAKISDELVGRTAQYSASRQQFRSYLEALANKNGTAVVRLQHLELRMLDTVVNDRRGVSSTKPPPFFSLTLSVEGMSETRNGVAKDTSRVAIGCIPKTSLQAGGIKSLMLRCHPRPTPTSTRPRPRLNTTDIVLRDIHIDHHRSPWRLAEPVVSLLRAELVRDSYLFSLTTYMDEPHLYLEGSIVSLQAVDT